MVYQMRQKRRIEDIVTYTVILLLIAGLAFWLRCRQTASGIADAGIINFSLGVLILSAYVSGQLMSFFRLPLLTGYIFTGIIAGPYVSGFLTQDMVMRLRLIDDLALSFIALSAGCAFHLRSMGKRLKTIGLNIVFQTIIIFITIFVFIRFTGSFFSFTRNLSSVQLTVIALFLGVIAISLSPSSAIAIISECRAKGVFTDTVLGVIVAMDMFIIILFTLVIAAARMLIVPGASSDPMTAGLLFLEIAVSILLGIISGRLIVFYIKRAGHDLTLLLIFFAFGIARASIWLNDFMYGSFNISIHLEPLIICMSTGFFIQNFSTTGDQVEQNIERVSLPIYVLFFSLAGASLTLPALLITWHIALGLTIIRTAGIFCGSWLAGRLSGEDPLHSRLAWMAYMTQAGVSIGLAQLAKTKYPEIGMYLNTIVLALITINQIIGPITFKIALNRAGETKNY